MPKIAAADRVDREALLEFLRPRHQAVLLTRRRSGGAQLSPVTCGLDSEGRIVVSTYPQRAKVANARRNPDVSMCVLSPDWDGAWVQVDGRAEVLELPEALEPLVDYYPVDQRGAPRLGRVPRRHEPPGEGAPAHHGHRMGSACYLRLPCGGDRRALTLAMDDERCHTC